LVGFRGHKRGAAIGLAIALAAMALVTILAAVALAAPRLGFLHIRSNLSRTATIVSVYPNLAVSPDGEWVVVVWTERFDEQGDELGHVYLRAASESGGGWGSKITIFSGDSSARASDANATVAVTGTTAHVLYVVSKLNYLGVVAEREVRYRTCSLTSGQCDGEQIVFVETDATYAIPRVDITLDEDGHAHAVWARHKSEPTLGEIYYDTPIAGVWNSGNRQRVDEAEISKEPAIAWDGGYAYVVWEDETNHRIRYRKREDALGWSTVITSLVPSSYSPSNPDVAVREGQVFIVWDMRPGTGSSEDCEEYYLAYWRSGWATDECREVGTNYPPELFEGVYRSTEDVTFLEGDEYFLDLRPSIALNADGGPAVVWHADHGGDCDEYTVYYTYAITGGDDSGVNWVITTSTALNYDQLGSAVIGIGEPAGDEQQHLHVAYMKKLSLRAWDVYYDSNEWDDYYHVYLPLVMRAYD